MHQASIIDKELSFGFSFTFVDAETIFHSDANNQFEQALPKISEGIHDMNARFYLLRVLNIF